MVSRHEKNTESLEEDGLRCLLGQILKDVMGRLFMNQSTQISSPKILYLPRLILKHILYLGTSTFTQRESVTTWAV